jgi:hypothetical protein
MRLIITNWTFGIVDPNHESMDGDICIVGKWKYETFINLESNKEIDLEFSPLKNVETEFTAQGMYIQTNIGSNGELFTRSGQWSSLSEKTVRFKFDSKEEWVNVDVLYCDDERLTLSNGNIEMRMFRI